MKAVVVLLLRTFGMQLAVVRRWAAVAPEADRGRRRGVAAESLKAGADLFWLYSVVSWVHQGGAMKRKKFL